MKLLLACRGNFLSTRKLLTALKGKVSEIYLSVFNPAYSSGRTYVHNVELKELEKINNFAAKMGIEVVVAFNTPCLGGKETLPAFQKELFELFTRINRLGIEKLILSHPLLIKWVRRHFPRIKIIVSVFAEVDSLEKLKYYEALGVSRITIPHELNRKLPELKKLARNTSLPLELITNLACVSHCSRADSHCRYVGHSSREILAESLGDCYLSRCDSFRINRPWEVLGTDFIRPEDLYRYEEIGIEYFKVAGRATSTSWLIRAANAYLNREFKGNLFSLLTQYYPYTDRLAGKSPFYLPNPRLTPYMDYLYNCPRHCWECDWCRKLYAGQLPEFGKNG